MKKSIVSILLPVVAMFLALSLSAQQPEKVYSIVKQIQTFEWYQDQAVAWKNVLDNDPSNAPAWQYYFTANRMARLVAPDRWKSAKGKVFQDPEAIVSAADKAVPGSFEALYIRIWNRGSEYADYKKDLFLAYELCNGKAEILDEMVMYYELYRNVEKRAEINKQWFRTNDVSAGIINYNYNVLQTLDDDAVIITGGDNDTFPLWMLQDAMGIKPAVAVLNISLLTKADYRKRVFAELNISDLKVQPGDGKDQDSMVTQRKRIVSQIVENSKRPVYLAVTLDAGCYTGSPVENNLYLSGLALRYQSVEFDNLAVLRRHVENDYLLDYLVAGFSEDPSSSVVAQINTGYLPGFIKLCSHYKLSGESNKLARVKMFMNRIAEAAGNPEELKSYIQCE